MPETQTQFTTADPRTPPLKPIPINEFLEILRPKIKDFLNSSRLPVWIPPETVDENLRQFYRNQAIPSTGDDEPNLLLHNLGKEPNPNADILFGNGSHYRILCNTSGAGKTALIFNGLCRHWGFYFTAIRGVNKIGASDLEQSISVMRHTPGWTEDVFQHPSPSAANSQNEIIAYKRLQRVLLARWIIFYTFIKVAKEQNGGNLPQDIKHDWLMFQVLPIVLMNGMDPFLAFISFCPLDMSLDDVERMLFTLSPERILGSAFNYERDRFFYVLDEAQAAGEWYKDAFTDRKAQIRLSVLSPIITTWQDLTSFLSIRFIVSGTRFSSDLFATLSVGGAGKPKEWVMVCKTGNFTSRDVQLSYISRYLPPTFLSSQSGQVLVSRMYEWLRGRHRFTASFLEQLLKGDWTADGPRSPHKLLNAFVRIFTEFTPIDGDGSLVATEPDVRPSQLHGITWEWERLRQDKHVLQKVSTSLYTYLTEGEYPKWYKKQQDLVGYGIARFLGGEGDDVIIDEPLALVGIIRCFEKEGLEEVKLHTRMLWSNRFAFEESVFLSCSRLFQRGACLSDVFHFYGEVPEWGRQIARIVGLNRQDLIFSDTATGSPISPSTGVAHFAENPNDVKEWIMSKPTAWCVPGKYMGPDLMAWLRLEDGKLLLLMIQTNCHLGGNTDTPELQSTANAISSLCPSSFYSHLTSQLAELETAEMLAAINNPDESFTGAQYNILRVVAAYPLNANIDTERSLEVRAAAEKDEHPLATLSCQALLASLATDDSTPTILSSLKSTLKSLRGADLKRRRSEDDSEGQGRAKQVKEICQ